MQMGDYPEKLSTASVISYSITERLENRKKNLENDLEQINQALDALKKHPETQAVLDMLAKVNA